jgi:drug/metabolite transporter (DMT)-like permease
MTVSRPGNWVFYALITVALWGVWGALAGLSAQHGFPDTLVYCVWSLTMIPPALVVLARDSWKLDVSGRAVAYGLTVGLLGAGGQMLLFKALTIGPAYFIFPIISLSPAITIAMSFLLLRERTGKLGALGIVLALAALPLFDLSLGQSDGSSSGQGLAWFALALLIMAAWGVQAYFMKLANNTVSAASIFFYMMVGGLLLAPLAWAWTDFTQPVNMAWDGPWMTAGIQILNAIGALTLVFAFRYGKAIVVAPLTNAGAPLVTAVLALAFAGAVPGPLKILGLALALIASLLLVIEPEQPAAAVNKTANPTANPGSGA